MLKNNKVKRDKAWPLMARTRLGIVSEEGEIVTNKIEKIKRKEKPKKNEEVKRRENGETKIGEKKRRKPRN